MLLGRTRVPFVIKEITQNQIDAQTCVPVELAGPIQMTFSNIFYKIRWPFTRRQGNTKSSLDCTVASKHKG